MAPRPKNKDRVTSLKCAGKSDRELPAENSKSPLIDLLHLIIFFDIHNYLKDLTMSK